MAKRAKITRERLGVAIEPIVGSVAAKWTIDSVTIPMGVKLSAAEAARAKAALDQWAQSVNKAARDKTVSKLTEETMMRGINASKTQSKRRKGKPAGDSGDTGRDERLRDFHARLVASGEHDATDQTAKQFGVSRRTVQRVLSQE